MGRTQPAISRVRLFDRAKGHSIGGYPIFPGAPPNAPRRNGSLREHTLRNGSRRDYDFRSACSDGCLDRHRAGASVRVDLLAFVPCPSVGGLSLWHRRWTTRSPQQSLKTALANVRRGQRILGMPPMAETKKTKGSWSPLAVEDQLDQINAKNEAEAIEGKRSMITRDERLDCSASLSSRSVAQFVRTGHGLKRLRAVPSLTAFRPRAPLSAVTWRS